VPSTAQRTVRSAHHHRRLRQSTPLCILATHLLLVHVVAYCGCLKELVLVLVLAVRCLQRRRACRAISYTHGKHRVGARSGVCEGRVGAEGTQGNGTSSIGTHVSVSAVLSNMSAPPSSSSDKSPVYPRSPSSSILGFSFRMTSRRSMFFRLEGDSPDHVPCLYAPCNSEWGYPRAQSNSGV
jgi:hypothetical protein